MPTLQLKQFISFLDNTRDLNFVKKWSKNDVIESYIDNLLNKI